MVIVIFEHFEKRCFSLCNLLKNPIMYSRQSFSLFLIIEVGTPPPKPSEPFEPLPLLSNLVYEPAVLNTHCRRKGLLQSLFSYIDHPWTIIHRWFHPCEIVTSHVSEARTVALIADTSPRSPSAGCSRVFRGMHLSPDARLFENQSSFNIPCIHQKS